MHNKDYCGAVKAVCCNHNAEFAMTSSENITCLPGESKPRKALNTVFTVVCVAVAMLNVWFGNLNYVIWSAGGVSQDTYAWIRSLPGGELVIASIITAAGILLTFITYVLSLDYQRPRRPFWRVYVLGVSFVCFLAGYVLAFMGIPQDSLAAFMLVGVVALTAPLLVIYIERVAGKASLGAAASLSRSGNARRAIPFARRALAFLPGNMEGRMILGLGLADAGRQSEAAPYLEETFHNGGRTPQLLAALAGVYEQAGNNAAAADVIGEWHRAAPDAGLFRRMIELWLRIGQRDRALSQLQQLTSEARGPWLDVMRDLLLENGDTGGVRALCREYEKDGPPFQRAKQCYMNLLAHDPYDMQSLKALLQLTKQSFDEEGAVGILEKLTVLNPADGQYRRELIEHYRVRSKPHEVMRHLEALATSGAATVGEKLEYLDRLFSLGEYDRVEEMVKTNSDLAGNARAVFIHASMFYETDRTDEAAKRLAEARKQDGGGELSAQITSLDSRIRARLLDRELKEFASRAEADPGNIGLQFQYFDRLLESGAADKVVERLEEMLTNQPDMRDRVVAEIGKIMERHGRNSRLLIYLSDIYLRGRDWDNMHRAIKEMAAISLHSDAVLKDGASRILKENPHYAPSLLIYSQQAYKSGQYSVALDHLDKYYAAQGPRNSEIIRFEYDLCKEAGQADRALRIGDELLHSHPDHIGLLTGQADLCEQLSLYEQGARHLQRVAELSADPAQVRLRIRDFEEKRKRARIAELQKFVEESPKDAVAFAEMGDLYYDFAQFNDAIVAYQKAAHAAPSQSIAKAKLGYVLERKGMHTECEDIIEQVELTIDQPAKEQDELKALLYATGEMLEENDKFQLAVKIYRRIFRVDAGYRDVVGRIEYIERFGSKKKSLWT